MFRSRGMMVLGTSLLLFGGTTPVASAADPPVTLRLAIAADEGAPVATGARAFVDEVASRSGGSVAIEPIWDAGASYAGKTFEQAVTQQLVDGQTDLAIVPSRGWDSAGVTSLEALETPFLITDDELAKAVTTGPIAEELLAGMEAGGVTGLAMWPEDLVHFVDWGCIDEFTPAKLAETTIRAVPSAVADAMVRALGATAIFTTDWGVDASACKIDAALVGFRNARGLPNGQQTYRGDLTPFPKVDVLAANAAAFGRLTPAQQAIVRDAATAARDRATAAYQPETEAAAAWCAAGEAIALVGADDIAAFETALQPVIDHLNADPVAAHAIAEISALKSTTTPAPGAQACEAGPPATTAPLPTPDLSAYLGTIPPDGTYRANVTADDLVAKGADPLFAVRQAKIYTLAFHGDLATWQEGLNAPCDNDVTSDGNVFSIREQQPDTCLGGDYRWREVPGGIELVPIVGADWPNQDKLNDYALFYRVWTKID
jgi:C4-dicarboxylate-binding protein DctP